MNCIHHVFSNLSGRIHLTVGDTMDLHVHGVLEGVDTSKPVEICVQPSRPSFLPRVLQRWGGLTHSVPYHDNQLHCTSDWVDFDRWELNLPFIPRIPLQSVIGMSAVHIVIQQGSTTYGRMVVQRRRHCVQLGH